ncbi:MAG: hypothetical protein ACO1RT_07005 [Planctomycetaceae bacterium]
MISFRPAVIGAAILWAGLGSAAVQAQGHGHHDHGNHHWHGGHHGHHGHGGHYGGGHYGGGHYGHDHHWHGGYGGSGWGYSYPRYSGFSLSIGSPYSFYGLGVTSPYSYGYRSDYFDYRNDYYNQLFDSYRRDIQLNLRYPSSSYLYGSGNALTPSLGLPSYYPPVATLEPLGSSAVIVAKPSGVVSTQSRLPLPADNLPADAIPGALRDAAHRLSANLSRRPNDADIWLGYLAPDRILAALDSGSSPKRMAELLRSYDGVTANPSLDWLVRTDGFEATRRLLRQWIESSATASAQTTSPAAATPAPPRSKPIPPQDPPASESGEPAATEQQESAASPPSPTAEPVGTTTSSERRSL